MGLISLLIFLPLAGAVLIALGPREKPGLLRGIALTTSVVTFLLSLGLFTRFVAGEGGFQLVETLPWVPGLGITYRVGIDGISLFLVLLSTLLSVVAMAASWSDIKVRVKEFMICLLFLETGMIGVFVALDLFLFYVFWEVMLIPMYLLIGIWGNPGAPHLCRSQVLSFHHVWQPADAGCDSGDLFLSRQNHRHVHV